MAPPPHHRRGFRELDNQEESGHLITTNIELSAKVQEFEQQIIDLKVELQQKEVEPEGFEDADSVIALRDLFNLDEDNGRVITNDDFLETQIDDDTISIPTRLDTSFLSPPPTMPNTRANILGLRKEPNKGDFQEILLYEMKIS